MKKDLMQKETNVSHKRARGLSRRPPEDIKGYYESILARRHTTSFTGADIVAVLKDYTALCEREEERKRATSRALRAVFGRMSKAEREAFARDGSLPDWLFTEPEPPSQDKPKGERLRATYPGHMVSSLAEEEIRRST